MKSIARLKEQARLHEQKEEWDKAIQAYEQALELSEQGPGGPDLQLFNRIGSYWAGWTPCGLRRRLRTGTRRRFLQQRHRFVQQTLQYAPDRAELYRKLGRYSGAQGSSPTRGYASNTRKAEGGCLVGNSVRSRAGGPGRRCGAADAGAATRAQRGREGGPAASPRVRAAAAAGGAKEAEADAKRLRQLDPTGELPSASASAHPQGSQRGAASG